MKNGNCFTSCKSGFGFSKFTSMFVEYGPKVQLMYEDLHRATVLGNALIIM